jgi:hypothetical protein
VPETRSAAAVINQWLQENRPQVGGTVERFLGKCQFELRGQSITSAAQPYRFFLLQRVHAIFDTLGSAEQQVVREMLERCGMGELLAIRLDRSLAQVDNLEVWGG